MYLQVPDAEPGRSTPVTMAAMLLFLWLCKPVYDNTYCELCTDWVWTSRRLICLPLPVCNLYLHLEFL
jgi:hypothetical protein